MDTQTQTVNCPTGDYPATPGGANGAQRLLDLVTANWMTQAIYVAAALGLPERIAAGVRNSDALAAATGAHAPSVHRLLRALVTLGLCSETADGTFALTQEGELLRADSPQSLRAWTLYWGGTLWATWGSLLHSVRTGESARALVTGREGFAGLTDDPALAELFHQAMREGTRQVACGVVAAVDFAGMHRIVDVGGGDGELLAAILEANPLLGGAVLELPHAVAGARAHLASRGPGARAGVIAGDFFEAVPGEADALVAFTR